MKRVAIFKLSLFVILFLAACTNKRKHNTFSSLPSHAETDTTIGNDPVDTVTVRYASPAYIANDVDFSCGNFETSFPADMKHTWASKDKQILDSIGAYIHNFTFLHWGAPYVRAYIEWESYGSFHDYCFDTDGNFIYDNKLYKNELLFNFLKKYVRLETKQTTTKDSVITIVNKEPGGNNFNMP